MSANDLVLLQNVIKQAKAKLAAGMKDSSFVELFAGLQILKDYDLSYEEVEAGLVGGGGDGGIDSVYLFVNGELIQEDTNFSDDYKRPVSIELHILQSKSSGGFTEDAIDRLYASTLDLLDLSKEISSLAVTYNTHLLEAIGLFRKAYLDLASKFPSLTIAYYYASMGAEVHPNVKKKAEKLEALVNQFFSKSKAVFTFIGASELLNLARKAPNISFSLNLAEAPISSSKDIAYICLVPLQEYFSFMTDGGHLVRSLFETNVRDYQGSTQVNDAIQATLKEKQDEDFWWLNNGITVLAGEAVLSGKKLTLLNPQIVNGLQTSNEIFKHFSSTTTKDESRNVLVRIIVPKKSESRDRIIKATNSQTQIPSVSLRATEKIHRDIEEFLHPYGLFYDRRKNFYKNEGKSIESILSIQSMAQAVMAIVLRRPNDARARPSSVLRNDDDYNKIFSPQYPIPLYRTCAVVLKKVESFIKSENTTLTQQERNNLKFHLAMYVALLLSGKDNPSIEELAKAPLDKLDNKVLSLGLEEVRSVYTKLGGTDQIAKGPELVRLLLDKFVSNLSSQTKK